MPRSRRARFLVDRSIGAPRRVRRAHKKLVSRPHADDLRPSRRRSALHERSYAMKWTGRSVFGASVALLGCSIVDARQPGGGGPAAPRRLPDDRRRPLARKRRRRSTACSTSACGSRRRRSRTSSRASRPRESRRPRRPKCGCCYGDDASTSASSASTPNPARS